MKKKMNDYVAPSHYERRHNSDFCPKRRAKVLNTPHERRSIEETVDNGVVVKRVVMVKENPVDKFKGLKTTDFALENIIAAGAVDMLRDCKLSYATSGEASDNVDVNVSAIESAIEQEMAQNNVENSEE